MRFYFFLTTETILFFDEVRDFTCAHTHFEDDVGRKEKNYENVPVRKNYLEKYIGKGEKNTFVWFENGILSQVCEL